jgi:hypothetical protein
VARPVFVLTHHLASHSRWRGGTTFHFFTDGIEAALKQIRAIEAAGVTHISYRIRRST